MKSENGQLMLKEENVSPCSLLLKYWISLMVMSVLECLPVSLPPSLFSSEDKFISAVPESGKGGTNWFIIYRKVQSLSLAEPEIAWLCKDCLQFNDSQKTVWYAFAMFLRPGSELTRMPSLHLRPHGYFLIGNYIILIDVQLRNKSTETSFLELSSWGFLLCPAACPGPIMIGRVVFCD